MPTPVDVSKAIDKARTIAGGSKCQVWTYPSQLDMVVNAIRPAVDYLEALGQPIIIHPHDSPSEVVARIEGSIMAMSAAPGGESPTCRNNGGPTKCGTLPPGQQWCELCERRGRL